MLSVVTWLLACLPACRIDSSHECFKCILTHTKGDFCGKIKCGHRFREETREKKSQQQRAGDIFPRKIVKWMALFMRTRWCLIKKQTVRVFFTAFMLLLLLSLRSFRTIFRLTRRKCVSHIFRSLSLSLDLRFAVVSYWRSSSAILLFFFGKKDNKKTRMHTRFEWCEQVKQLVLTRAHYCCIPPWKSDPIRAHTRTHKAHIIQVDKNVYQQFDDNDGSFRRCIAPSLSLSRTVFSVAPLISICAPNRTNKKKLCGARRYTNPNISFVILCMVYIFYFTFFLLFLPFLRYHQTVRTKKMCAASRLKCVCGFSVFRWWISFHSLEPHH